MPTANCFVKGCQGMMIQRSNGAIYICATCGASATMDYMLGFWDGYKAGLDKGK